MPELQGRLPIRVELNKLSKEDIIRILSEPKFEDVVKNNPEYFKSVFEGKRNIKFYDLDHKDSFSIFSSNPDAASLKRLFITIFDPVVRIQTADYYSLIKSGM